MPNGHDSEDRIDTLTRKQVETMITEANAALTLNIRAAVDSQYGEILSDLRTELDTVKRHLAVMERRILGERPPTYNCPNCSRKVDPTQSLCKICGKSYDVSEITPT